VPEKRFAEPLSGAMALRLRLIATVEHPSDRDQMGFAAPEQF